MEMHTRRPLYNIRRWTSRLSEMLTRLKAAVKAELRTRQAVAELARMDDWTLRDMGIHRSEIESVIRRGRAKRAAKESKPKHSTAPGPYPISGVGSNLEWSADMSLDLPTTPRGVPKVDPQEFRPDAHACFAKYRRLTGLIDTGGGVVVVIRHADVERLLTDPKTRQAEADFVEVRGVTSGALHSFFSESMLTSNAPFHMRRRAPAARAFAFKLIQEWRPRIRRLVADLIEGNIHNGEMEFVQSIASPLPARIIAEILGIPEEEAPQFAALVYGMSRGFSNFRPDELPAIEASATDLMAYVENLLDSRRHRPRDDFLTDYLKTAAEAGLLSETETLVQIVTLIIGGSDTTRFGLTATVSLLLQHRSQWELVCADPSLAPEAVREVLRFEPPAATIGRVVTEPLSIDGMQLDPGTILALSICSAQRDETVFRDPDRFDITRKDHPKWSVSFGLGPHRCLGEALARAEMEECLIAISQRLPSLELADGPASLKGYSGLRAIGPLPLRWSQA